MSIIMRRSVPQRKMVPMGQSEKNGDIGDIGDIGDTILLTSRKFVP
jgi:hypothetical protein